MFGKIGMWEIILICAVALIVFGPAKLPELGRSIGRGLREFRQAARDIGQSISLEDEKEGEQKSYQRSFSGGGIIWFTVYRLPGRS